MPRSTITIPLPLNRNRQTLVAVAESRANKLAARVGTVVPATSKVVARRTHYEVTFELRAHKQAAIVRRRI